MQHWTKRSQVDRRRAQSGLRPPLSMCLTPDLWGRGECVPDQSQEQPQDELTYSHNSIIDALYLKPCRHFIIIISLHSSQTCLTVTPASNSALCSKFHPLKWPTCFHNTKLHKSNKCPFQTCPSLCKCVLRELYKSAHLQYAQVFIESCDINIKATAA